MAFGRSPQPHSSPVERALLNNPNISNDQNTEEHQHFDKSEEGELLENDGPRKKKNRLHIEDHEQDRDNVIADRVALARIGFRIHAAFVRGELAFAATLRPD